jgi:hypothetical protein
MNLPYQVSTIVGAYPQDRIEGLKARRIVMVRFVDSLNGLLVSALACAIPKVLVSAEQGQGFNYAKQIICSFTNSLQELLTFDVDQELRNIHKALQQQPQAFDAALVSLCAERDEIQRSLDEFSEGEEKVSKEHPEIIEALGPVWGMLKGSLTKQLQQINSSITMLQEQIEKQSPRQEQQ